MPGAFPEVGGRFPAVVFGDKIISDESGLDEATVRSLSPYDGEMPPYSLNYEHGHNLLDAFKSRSMEIEHFPLIVEKPQEIGKFVTEDGHRVKSQGELLIDNWLFNNKILHAYGYYVQKAGEAHACDFYIPQHDIYVEYWGMIGNPKYDESRKSRLRFYQANHLKLLQIFPRDLSALSEILKQKLMNLGMQV